VVHRAPVDAGAVRVLESRSDALGDQERVLGGDADAESAHASEQRVERPASRLVPGVVGDALHQAQLRLAHDCLVQERPAAVLLYRRSHALRRQIGRLQDPQADETPLIRRVERPEHRAKSVFGELSHQ
jgi:hypothetical protein